MLRKITVDFGGQIKSFPLFGNKHAPKTKDTKKNTPKKKK